MELCPSASDAVSWPPAGADCLDLSRELAWAWAQDNFEALCRCSCDRAQSCPERGCGGARGLERAARPLHTVVVVGRDLSPEHKRCKVPLERDGHQGARRMPKSYGMGAGAPGTGLPGAPESPAEEQAASSRGPATTVSRHPPETRRPCCPVTRQAPKSPGGPDAAGHRAGTQRFPPRPAPPAQGRRAWGPKSLFRKLLRL